ncbi:MAG: hypothetical protein JWM88_2088 [Verrucomicrobia bacterium]|nr:hypothetical protein [Verrucomicrobiota bacterium]
MQRTLQPELLDSLASTDPAALHNRRDLRITNCVMGNHRWFLRSLPPLLGPGERVLELGAGTGELARRLHRAGLNVDGLDLWPRPDGWPSSAAWHRTDLLEFSGGAPYAAVVGNLIFHQFDPAQLAALGANLRAHSRVILACEPARRRFSQALFGVFAPLLGANHVSRHDGLVSIAAGFRGDELPRLLGLETAGWNVHCATTALGAYRMVAIRHPS